MSSTAIPPQTEIPKLIKDLAETFSRQSKYSNQLWLALVVAAAVVIFPNINGHNITLPFSLAVVDKDIYVRIGFLILTVLIIAYCQAFAQAQQAAWLAHRLIDKLDDQWARSLYDVSVTATFTRVAPLVDLLILQLGSRTTIKPSTLSRLAAVYYGLMKILANGVILGIPAGAVYTGYLRWMENPSILSWERFVAPLMLMITVIPMLQAIWATYRQSRRVFGLYWNGKLINRDPIRQG
jgi:hypothetical protein